MPVETLAKTAESAAVLVAPLGAHSGTARWAAACAIRSLNEDNADLRRELEAAQSDLKRTKGHANRLAGERDAANAARLAAEGERDRLREALQGFVNWASRKCPCHNDEPNPCPLCGASVENLEACKAADETLPRALLTQARAALTPAPEAPKDGE